MIKTLKSIETNFSVSRAAFIIGFFSLLSRLAGLLRDRLFASKFGAGDELDIYYAAFRIPDFIFNLLVLGTLSVAFIPVFTEWLLKDRQKAYRIANTVLNASVISMGLICAVLFIFVLPLTRMLVPGFSGEKFIATVSLTRIFLLSPIIFTISNVFGSILNAQKKFLIASLAPVIYNIGIIAGLLLLYPRYGLSGLGFGVVLGALMHLLIQMAESIRHGFSWLPVLDLKDEAVKKIGKLFLPRIIGLDASQISLIAGSVIGSLLASGTIAILNLANNLQAVPLGIFAVSIAIAVFPSLSESYAKNDEPEFIRTLYSAAKRILFFIIPITVLMLLYRAYIVRLAYGAGRFNWENTITTFNTMGIFSFSLFSQSLIPLLARAFYARKNTRTPVLVSIFSMTTNVLLSYFFGLKFGVIGIAIGFSAASIINCALLFILLSGELGRSKSSNGQMQQEGHNLLSAVLRTSLASIVMGTVGYAVIYLMAPLVNTRTGLGILLQSGISGLLSIGAFLIASHWLKLEQARGLTVRVKRLFRLPA